MEVGERLRVAIDRWGKGRRGIRPFSEELERRKGENPKLRGTSRNMIQRYISGLDTPPLEFLSVAAEVLGVRPAWLAFADGEPTEAEQRRAGAPPFDPEDAAILKGIEAEFSAFGEADWLGRTLILSEGQNLAWEISGTAEWAARPRLEVAAEAGRRIGRALKAFTYEITGRDKPWSPLTRSRFLAAAAPVLAVVSGDAGQEQPWVSLGEEVFGRRLRPLVGPETMRRSSAPATSSRGQTDEEETDAEA